MKKDIADRQAATRAELDSMDTATRQALEGFRPGAYVRLRISQAPCELVDCFEPSTPLLIGGLSQGEEKVGFMHLRFKRHRWYPKILKNRDPLVLSAGWRRYQTLPVFSQEDNNGRHRMLKYTPEHMHCRATVFGPLVPPQTGIIAVQNLAGSLSSWRISGTAVMMELDARFDIMKKLKLVGHPYKIERHTAFIKDMFTSEVCTAVTCHGDELLSAAVLADCCAAQLSRQLSVPRLMCLVHGFWPQNLARTRAHLSCRRLEKNKKKSADAHCRWKSPSSLAPLCAQSLASVAL